MVIGYFASRVNVVSSNHCVGLSPRIKLSLFLLSICTDELIKTPKITTFFHTLPSVNENNEKESSRMPSFLNFYLSRPANLSYLYRSK